MNDTSVIRCVSIMGGVALLITCLVTGMDGEVRTGAAGMIGFGLGVPVGEWISKKVPENDS